MSVSVLRPPGPRPRRLWARLAGWVLLSLAAPGCTEDRAADLPRDQATAPDRARDPDLRGPDARRPDRGAPDLRPPDNRIAAPDQAPGPLKVLFVGNSYTFQNNLPGLVRDLAASDTGAPKVQVDQATAGGLTVQAHYQNATTLAKVSSGGFSHVVIQGQSQEPLIQPTVFHQYAVLLGQAAAKGGATPVFFETWARKAGHPEYQQSWTGGSPKAMQAGLRKGYQAAAQAAGGVVAPVGDAWEAMLVRHPGVDLHDGDGAHPSVTGSYLAACVIHAVLTGRTPVGLTYRPKGVDTATAQKAQTVAQDTVNPGP